MGRTGRRLGMSPDVASAEMEMLALLDDRPARYELACEARSILTGLGAVTLPRRPETGANACDVAEVVAG